MKAYELYQQDMAGGSELRRSASDRRTYYEQLRQAMREECMDYDGCRLLETFNQRRDAGQLERMYLLDAAAVWECYETVIDGNRSMRDLGRGLPYPVDGRILSWDEIQRLSEEGTLPVAIVEDETWNRMATLIRCCMSRGLLRDPADVDPRARIATEAPAPAEAPAPKPAYIVPGREAQLIAENEALRRLAEEKEAQSDELAREADELRREVDKLRGQMEQLRQHQDTARDYAARAAQSILDGHTEEAHAAAARLDGKLQRAVQELERAVAERQAAEASLNRTQEQLAADRAQLQALRQQEREAVQAIAAARTERDQAQQDAARAASEQQAVQAELEAAAAKLNAATQSLRELRRRMAETNRANDLTQRQTEALR